MCRPTAFGNTSDPTRQRSIPAWSVVRGSRMASKSQACARSSIERNALGPSRFGFQGLGPDRVEVRQLCIPFDQGWDLSDRMHGFVIQVPYGIADRSIMG